MSSYLLPVVSNSCEISIFPCRGFVTFLRKQIARYQKHQTKINGQQNVAIKIPQRHLRLVHMVGSIYKGWILQHFVPSSVAPLNKGYHIRVRNKIPKFSDSPFISTGWYKKLKHRVWITSKTACLSRYDRWSRRFSLLFYWFYYQSIKSIKKLIFIVQKNFWIKLSVEWYSSYQFHTNTGTMLA